MQKVARFANSVTSFCFDVFTYSTARSATIKSLRVGIAYRIVQVLLLSYIIGWELIHNKGYQTFETVSSAVTTKVKGQGFVPFNAMHNKSANRSDPSFYHELFRLRPDMDYRIMDTADYIIPPNEYNSMFIMTNFIRTEQTPGFCDEEYSKGKCKSDDDCRRYGTLINTWNGIPTGKCLNSSKKANLHSCEIKGWCPVEHEDDRFEDNIVRNVLNYTIFIKNDVEFKKFNKKQRNILRNITNAYLSRCNYDDLKDPYCPIFRLNYILNKAEPNETERYMMLLMGGVVVIEVSWVCDFDLTSRCLPTYAFRRFDLPFGHTKTASGFNFRFANKFKYNGMDYRILYKAFGIRIIINVSGVAGKFNIIPLMMTIGTGFGLMSISVLVADCVMLHCTKEKAFFQKMKELDIKESIKLAEIPLPNHIARV